MFNSLDKGALILIQALENEEMDGSGNYATPIKTRMEVFNMAQAWMAKRQKMKPIDAGSDSGIKMLQELMSDPENVVERLHDDPDFQRALRSRGWLPPLTKKNGRPTAAEARTRAEYDQRKKDLKQVVSKSDDSALQKLLGAQEKEED